MVPPQTTKFTMRGQFFCWRLARESRIGQVAAIVQLGSKNRRSKGGEGTGARGALVPRGRILVEDQARSVSQAGVTLASNACEFSMTSAVSGEARVPAPSAA